MIICEGELARSDPLYDFLRMEVLGYTLGYSDHDHQFYLTSLDDSGVVYRCFDECTRVDLVLKCFGRKWIDGSLGHASKHRAVLARREFRNLIAVRTLGLNGGPRLVPRPLAVSGTDEVALVREHIVGTTTQEGVYSALRAAEVVSPLLEQIVREVALFLKDLHDRSGGHGSTGTVTGSDSIQGLAALVNQLLRDGTLDSQTHSRLEGLVQTWKDSKLLSHTGRVFCVGDANFSNFVRSPTGALAHIDLEAAGWHDYTYDLGCVAAELKHLFMLHGLGRDRSEEFISLLYNCYYGFGAAPDETFVEMTERGRFFMAFFELRMARNGWLELGYRRELIREAIGCLS